VQLDFLEIGSYDRVHSESISKKADYIQRSTSQRLGGLGGRLSSNHSRRYRVRKFAIDTTNDWRPPENIPSDPLSSAYSRSQDKPLIDAHCQFLSKNDRQFAHTHTHRSCSYNFKLSTTTYSSSYRDSLNNQNFASISFSYSHSSFSFRFFTISCRRQRRQSTFSSKHQVPYTRYSSHSESTFSLEEPKVRLQAHR